MAYSQVQIPQAEQDLAAADKPPKRPAERAWCKDSAALISAFDGTQPTLTQVPPIVP